MSVLAPVVGPDADQSQRDHQLQALYHRLNNQLGVVLAQAEVLESKAADDSIRNRAAQLVASTLTALATVRELRQRIDPSGDPPA